MIRQVSRAVGLCSGVPSLQTASFMHLIVLRGGFSFQSLRKTDAIAPDNTKASGRLPFGINVYFFNTHMTHDVRDTARDCVKILQHNSYLASALGKQSIEGKTPALV